jgi:hypothetical protein
MSALVRAIVPARSAARCSGTMVCRASMCTHDLITIAVTALSSAARPNALIAPSLMARPIVALARKPEPNTFPPLFRPSRSLTGPFTIRSGAVPVVDCQTAQATYPSAASDSHADSTRGSIPAGSRPAPR